MKVSTFSLAVAAGLAVAGASSAQIVIDGTLDLSGYDLVSVQTVQTQFGDSSAAIDGGGSELNAAYASIEGDRLNLFFAGNLETNFNKFNIFIDSVAGGQNTITDVNPNYDPFNGGGFNNGLEPYQGFTFDAGFEADYVLGFNSGNFGGARTDVRFGVIGGAADDFDEYGAVFFDPNTGLTTNEGSVALSPTTANPFDFQNQINLGTEIKFGFDNSNTAGIAGGTQPADPDAALAVTTGFEFSIPLSAIGNPEGDILVSAHVNNGTGSFLSNQFLGGLEPVGGDDTVDPPIIAEQANLGGDGLGNFLGEPDGGAVVGVDAGVSQVDLNNLLGDQFFVIAQGGTPDALEGDYNGDGFVAQADLDLVLLNFGSGALPGGFDDDAVPGGGPFDGLISQNELDGVLLNFGNGTPPASVAAVPEPTTAALLGLAGAGLLARRRRHA